MGGGRGRIFRSIAVGQAHDAESLLALLSEEQLELIVCTRVDGVDTTLDEFLALESWSGQQVDLYTFDGWVIEAAAQIRLIIDQFRKSLVRLQR